jgi:hypothetical protein
MAGRSHPVAPAIGRKRVTSRAVPTPLLKGDTPVKRLLSLSFIPLLLLFGGAALAQGTAFSISVDEAGNGSLIDPTGLVITLPSSMGPDPGPGGLPSVLTYHLPAGLNGIQGDLLLTDGPNQTPLDVIRFNGDGTILFYSDSVDGVDDPADTPSPPQGLYTNLVSVPEVPVGAGDGATYIPNPGQPGFLDGGATYHILSDTTTDVPEPGALALLIGGGVSLLAFRRRRRA